MIRHFGRPASVTLSLVLAFSFTTVGAFMLGGVPKRTSVVLAVPALLRRGHS